MLTNIPTNIPTRRPTDVHTDFPTPANTNEQSANTSTTPNIMAEGGIIEQQSESNPDQNQIKLSTNSNNSAALIIGFVAGLLICCISAFCVMVYIKLKKASKEREKEMEGLSDINNNAVTGTSSVFSQASNTPGMYRITSISSQQSNPMRNEHEREDPVTVMYNDGAIEVHQHDKNQPDVNIVYDDETLTNTNNKVSMDHSELCEMNMMTPGNLSDMEGGVTTNELDINEVENEYITPDGNNTVVNVP